MNCDVDKNNQGETTMQNIKTKNKTQKIGFILLNGFTLITFANAIEVLRMSNYLSQEELYAWSVYQEEGTLASNGLSVSTTANTNMLLDCSMVFVCAGVDVRQGTTASIKLLLQQLAQKNIVLGGMCNGSIALALAKLMDGYDCAVHWESLPAAREVFPKVNFTDQLYVIEKDRLSCSGGSSASDMMLQLVKLHHGRALASSVAEQFVMDRIRDGQSIQYKTNPATMGVGFHHVETAIALMQANVDEVLSMQEIANCIALSLRQLERLFKRYYDVSPAQYYLRLRLRHAKDLLSQTSMSIMQVTVACGFLTSSHFSKAYRNFHGYSPSEQRKPHNPALKHKITGSGGVLNGPS